MMSIYAGRERTKLSYKILSAFIAFTFSFTSVVPPSYAQSIASLNLPVPGTMVAPSAAFVPVLLKGMTIYPDNPLQFDFIVDSGDTNFKEDQIKTESQRLVKYFLASMTIPKDDLWVNLSPYEKDRIIPDELGKTELGRDMLAQDYILKQLTASLMYPEKELGKEFWDKVYKLAKEKYGTTEIPVDTFNKVWILPETATVYEHGQTVYIVEAKLRVMLDADYLAMSHNVTKSQGHKDVAGDVVTATEGSPQQGSDPVTTEIVKEIILPAIEREVNYGQNFAPLRQIYHSLILAKWYKETIKNSLLSKIYVDQKKIAGVNIADATLKDKIYAKYMEAYKKGVFNYIKEDYDRLSNETIPRKYFSGGEFLRDVEITRVNRRIASEITDKPRHVLHMELAALGKGKSSSPVTTAEFFRQFDNIYTVTVNTDPKVYQTNREKQQTHSEWWETNEKRASLSEEEFNKDRKSEKRTFNPEDGFSAGLGVSAAYFLENNSSVKGDLFVLAMMLRDLEEETRKYLVLNPPGYWHFTILGIDINNKIVPEKEKTLGQASGTLIEKIEEVIGSQKNTQVGFARDLTLSPQQNISLQGYPLDGRLPIIREDLYKKTQNYREGLEGARKKAKGYHINIGTVKSDIPLAAYKKVIDVMKDWRNQGGEYRTTFKKIYQKEFESKEITMAGILKIDNFDLVYHRNDNLSNQFRHSSNFVFNWRSKKDEAIRYLYSQLSEEQLRTFVDEGRIQQAAKWLAMGWDIEANFMESEWREDGVGDDITYAGVAIKPIIPTTPKTHESTIMRLEDSSPYVRVSAINDLLKLEREDLDLGVVVSSLIETLKYEDPDARSAAVNALISIMPDFFDWLTRQDITIQQVVFSTLSNNKKGTAPDFSGQSSSPVSAEELRGKSEIARGNDRRWKMIEAVAAQGQEVAREELNNVYVKIGGQVLQLRVGGNLAIDITPAFQRPGENQWRVPTKTDAYLHFLDKRGINPSNAFFIGNETGNTGRDSEFLRAQIQTQGGGHSSDVTVIGVSTEPGDLTQQGIIPVKNFAGAPQGGKTDNVKRTKFFLQKLINKLNLNQTPAQAVKDILREIGLEDRANKINEGEDIVIGFDIDDTLLGVRAEDSSQKETLDRDQPEIRDMLIELSQRGVKLVIFSDNAADNVKKNIADPILKESKNKKIKEFVLPEFYATGMTIPFKVDENGKILPDTDYSENHKISPNVVRTLSDLVGGIEERADGTMEGRGLLGDYYNLITDNTQHPAFPQRGGFLETYYPDYHFFNPDRRTEWGNLQISPIKERKVPGTEVVTQLNFEIVNKRQARQTQDVTMNHERARIESKGQFATKSSTKPSSPLTKREAREMLEAKLDPKHHHLIKDENVRQVTESDGQFDVNFFDGIEYLIPLDIYGIPGEDLPAYILESQYNSMVRNGDPKADMYDPFHKESRFNPDLGHIEIVPKGQSSSPVTDQGTGSRVQGTELRANDERRNTSDEEVGGIDMNSIDLDREGGGVDIQFDPAQLQELIDAGIDGFAPVIINIVPLPSVLPLLGLDPANKEEELEVSRLN